MSADNLTQGLISFSLCKPNIGGKFELISDQADSQTCRMTYKSCINQLVLVDRSNISQ